MNSGIIDEGRISSDLKGSGRGLVAQRRYCPSIYQEGLRNTTKILTLADMLNKIRNKRIPNLSLKQDRYADSLSFQYSSYIIS
jgi:hypothetical protein